LSSGCFGAKRRAPMGRTEAFVIVDSCLSIGLISRRTHVPTTRHWSCCGWSSQRVPTLVTPETMGEKGRLVRSMKGTLVVPFINLGPDPSRGSFLLVGSNVDLLRRSKDSLGAKLRILQHKRYQVHRRQSRTLVTQPQSSCLSGHVLLLASIATEKCSICPRTPVRDVAGPYRAANQSAQRARNGASESWWTLSADQEEFR